MNQLALRRVFKVAIKSSIQPSIFILCLSLSAPVMAEPLCANYDLFIDQGWEHQAVQDAMDRYMRDHRMRANWLNQPAPPDQIGRDYYEWLWHNDFGARMKAELINSFCGASDSTDYSTEE